MSDDLLIRINKAITAYNRVQDGTQKGATCAALYGTGDLLEIVGDLLIKVEALKNVVVRLKRKVNNPQ